MINVEIVLESGNYKSISVCGHAGFAPKGEDIICAAVSALVINTANSLSQLTKTKFQKRFNEGTALIEMTFDEVPDEKAKLLLDSLTLGLCSIEKEHGHISIKYKEV